MPNETQGGSQGQGEPGAGQGQQEGGTPESWDAWLEAQPQEVRALYETHTSGLRSALQSEREQRDDLARQLREATGALEEGSAAREALEQVNVQLEAAQRQADFYAEAARPETGCTNPRLAYLAAQEIDVFDRRGNVNWERLKEQFPELFKKQGPAPTHGGEGSGGPDRPLGPGRQHQQRRGRRTDAAA